MNQTPNHKRQRGPRALGALIGPVIDPVIARRGFAKAELLSAWSEIAGPLYASCTAPERILWPKRRDADEAAAGVLLLRVDGPQAILVQHELPAIIERINGYFGYQAIGQARIVQAPVAVKDTAESAAANDEAAALAANIERDVERAVGGVDPSPLRDALLRLGRGIKRATRE